jgi:carbon storage regulator CsrA
LACRTAGHRARGPGKFHSAAAGILDGDITVTLVEVKGSQVRLAFDAPDQVRILRGELVVQADDLESAEGPDDADLEMKPAEWQRTPRRPVLPRRKVYRRLACSR